jgi:hypothetical protein
MRKKLTYYLAMALLHSSKPFSAIGNALYMMHCKVIRKNRED